MHAEFQFNRGQLRAKKIRVETAGTSEQDARFLDRSAHLLATIRHLMESSKLEEGNDCLTISNSVVGSVIVRNSGEVATENKVQGDKCGSEVVIEALQKLADATDSLALSDSDRHAIRATALKLQEKAKLPVEERDDAVQIREAVSDLHKGFSITSSGIAIWNACGPTICNFFNAIC